MRTLLLPILIFFSLVLNQNAYGQTSYEVLKKAQTELANGKKAKAEKLFEETLEIAIAHNNIPVQMSCHLALAELKDNVLKYKAAMHHYKSYSRLHKLQVMRKTKVLEDSVSNLQTEVETVEMVILEKNRAIDSLTTKQLKARLAILDLKIDNQKKELQIKNSENKRAKLIFILVLSALLLSFVVVAYVQKIRANKTLRGKNQLIAIEKSKSENLLLELTKQKKILEDKNGEKEILLKEIHHRVKNNLQIIVSLLNLQSSKFENDQVIGAFKETQNRIISMGLVHQRMYQSANFDAIQFRDYVNLLIENNQVLFSSTEKQVSYINDTPSELKIDIETAIPLGLIINEMISNSFKHAFNNGKGDFQLSIKLEDTVNDSFVLLFKDNGPGFPDGFDLKKTDTLGIELISALTEQINGSLKCKNNNGAQYEFEFSKLENAPAFED